MNLRISSLVERLRASLFFVPMVAVILAAFLGIVGLRVDRSVDTDLADLPLGFTSTVESARTLLGVIAGATISFAGIAFSVSLLIIQLTSSQYSPRVVHTLFRDPFTKRVMALVVGTFTYCVVVLRSVRSALDPGAEPVIPNISVAIAVVLGIATILAVVAFINHSAHAMDVSEILDRISVETTRQIRAEWTSRSTERSGEGRVGPIPSPPAGPTSAIRAACSGWIQQIDTAALLERLPERTTAWVETCAGRYAIERTRLITVAPPTSDHKVEAALGSVFAIGSTRTMQQDVTYGLRQLVDVAVKALSPGINDPTTAQDAIFHIGAVLSELLHHDPPPAVVVDGSRCVVLTQQPTHPELIRIAFDEIRRAASLQPTVCLYLLATLDSLIESLGSDGPAASVAELRRQARLVAEGSGRTTPIDEDLASVRDVYARKFRGAPR